MDMKEKTQVSSAFGMMCDAFSDEMDEAIAKLQNEVQILHFPELEEYVKNLFGKKYYYNVTKSELEEYAKDMKAKREYYNWEFPAKRYSPDGKILYTESLIETLSDLGFEKIALICGSSMCVALNGFDGSYGEDGILQIGSFGFIGTEEQFFEAFPISSILMEKWGYWSAKNELDRDSALQLADEEYICMMDVEEKLARFMIENDIYAIIQI